MWLTSCSLSEIRLFQSEDVVNLSVTSLVVGLFGCSLGLPLDIYIDRDISPFILDFLIYWDIFVIAVFKVFPS